MMTAERLAKELNIGRGQAEAAVRLLDEGNTVPFIARYRKEATGGLTDEQLRNLYERLGYLRNLDEKKEQVLSSIEEQGLLTEDLKKSILAAETLVQVEDLYRPYRPKRKTRAGEARAKGLGELAEILKKEESRDPLGDAMAFVSEEKGVATAEEALQGAMDIVAEELSDTAEIRAHIRKLTTEKGMLISSGKSDETTVYDMYKNFSSPIQSIPGHRILAINRGEKEKVLSVKTEAPEEDILRYLEKKTVTKPDAATAEYLEKACEDAYRRLIAPSIEREIRNALTEKAEEGAIRVFGKNLEQLLMQPPLAGRTVLGWDPAFRTGCKLAVVDPTGKVRHTVVIYPTAPQNRVEEAKKTLKEIIRKYGVSVISLGNGTASRESEQVIAELFREMPEQLHYVIVNEAGASVYSASKLASEEFPNFDVGQRSAASIARRLQDPLAELVKIEPKSIGVGQYQHDMNQKKLEESLSGVVEDCVNRVGVDLNTASAPLLSYIAGISKPIASGIVSYREENGRFKNRRQLLKVPKLGPKAFEQCAGFLRIRGGDNFLDNTGVHPESYEAAEKLLSTLGYSEEEVGKTGALGLRKKAGDLKKLSQTLGIGEMTLSDIISELEKPGRDPREDAPKPVLRSDVMRLEDLKPGMILKGTVRNIMDFGVFVDIGVHQDGLVHISELSDRYVKHPLDVAKVGDVISVRVLSVDIARKRIQLSCKALDAK
ncbi:MAG: RNA-binding transcriptional accessory protein [Lachnospiraceae bacterium]|nr:RNA-binding transcriptional accessory protein [Lachnospiraceae bacterium]